MSADIVDRARAAHLARARGGHIGEPELIAALSCHRDPAARAWAVALRAQSELLGIHDSTLDVELPEVPASSLGVGEALHHLLAARVRRSLLTFDGASLATAGNGYDALAAQLGQERDAVAAEVARGWLGWLRGEPELGVLPTLGRRARAAGFAGLLIEVQTLRSLGALERGDVEDAVERARRASRMARSEAIPDCEVLANLALARARRFQNRPHLSLRILVGLLPHAPPAWRDWMRWEAAVAGGLNSIRHADPATHSGALVLLLRAVAEADEAELDARQEALLDSTRGAAPLRRDVDGILNLLVGGRAPESEGVAAWKSGASAVAPPGLQGIVFAARPAPGEVSNCTHVLARPDAPACRVSAPSVRLTALRLGADTGPACPPTQPRTDAGLAVLALAGRRLVVEDYFLQVYAYAYEPAAHATMFGMHVHRMRERLGDSATLHREDGFLELVPRRALLVRDPRCEEPVPQRTLRLLGSGGARTARELARLIGVPLRTMQRVLKELVVDEALVRSQQGRAVVYRVEDTTFSEPTRSRRFDVSGFSVEIDVGAALEV